MSSRRLKDIIARRLANTSWRRVEGVLKTSWRMSWIRLENVLKTSCKTSWRCFEDVLGRRFANTSWCRLEDVLKTSWKMKSVTLKTSWRRFGKQEMFGGLLAFCLFYFQILLTWIGSIVVPLKVPSNSPDFQKLKKEA